MRINYKLKQYITNNIFPSYEKNDLGHNLDHIKYVINRSLKFAKKIDDINYDMVYTIAAYHDIGHYIDAKNHEKISAKILLNDKNLKEFFNNEEINIMSEAVYDHRASLDDIPRSIYGKIVSSADRNTSVDSILKRTYEYRIEHSPNSSLEDIIEDSRNHIINKFGKNGYASEKMYFEDLDYKVFLNDIVVLSNNKEEFYKRYCRVNNINIIKEKNMDEYLVRSHVGGFYITSSEPELIEMYCETCGDSDQIETSWNSEEDGAKIDALSKYYSSESIDTKKDLLDLVNSFKSSGLDNQEVINYVIDNIVFNNESNKEMIEYLHENKDLNEEECNELFRRNKMDLKKQLSIIRDNLDEYLTSKNYIKKTNKTLAKYLTEKK